MNAPAPAFVLDAAALRRAREDARRDGASALALLEERAGLAPREFVAQLSRVVGRPARLPTPAFALRAVLGRRAGLMLASQRVVPRELERVGFSFRFNSIADALEHACADRSPHAHQFQEESLVTN